MLEVNIGGILKCARITLNKSRSQVAKDVNMSPSTIKSYEDDTVKPKLLNLIKLINYYHLDCKDFDISYKEFNKQFNNYYLKKIYYLNNEQIYEIIENNEIKFLKLNDYIISGNSKERLIKSLYKNRIWNRHIALGFNKKDIIDINTYVNLIQQECYYCGSINSQETQGFKHNGIDRLDSTKGYTEQNCVPCCTKCNMAKGSLTTREFLNLVNDIYINQKRKEL
jgi:DNA-binding XRE family transcriptional regulator